MKARSRNGALFFIGIFFVSVPLALAQGGGSPSAGANGEAGAPSGDGGASHSSNPDGGGASPMAAAGVDAGVDAAKVVADASPRATERQLQDEAEVERLRAARDRELTAAQAEATRTRQALGEINGLAIDFVEAQRKLSEAKESTPEEKKAADALRDVVARLRKEALKLDPELDVTAKSLEGSIERLTKRLEAANDDVAKKEKAKADLEADIRAHREKAVSVRSRLHYARQARCQTAYCFGGDGSEYAFEPMLELPIGTSFSIGDGALGKFNNATELSIQFSAGLRFWLAYDMVSFSVFFAKPIYSGDVKVRVPGSPYEHPTTAIRRLGPSFALGFVGDMIFVGGGYDQLRNGSSPGSSDPNYPPNAVLSRAFTVTIGIAPFAAIRNGAGAIAGSK